MLTMIDQIELSDRRAFHNTRSMSLREAGTRISLDAENAYRARFPQVTERAAEQYARDTMRTDIDRAIGACGRRFVHWTVDPDTTF